MVQPLHSWIPASWQRQEECWAPCRAVSPLPCVAFCYLVLFLVLASLGWVGMWITAVSFQMLLPFPKHWQQIQHLPGFGEKPSALHASAFILGWAVGRPSMGQCTGSVQDSVSRCVLLPEVGPQALLLARLSGSSSHLARSPPWAPPLWQGTLSWNEKPSRALDKRTVQNIGARIEQGSH